MGVRDQMVASAVVLLAKHGFQGASLARVLADSGAPRGSIYHHFPEGKDQLVAAAVEVAGERAVQVLDAFVGLSAVELVDGYMAIWRSILERSGFTAGCSVLAVTVSADSSELVEQAGQVFRSWPPPTPTRSPRCSSRPARVPWCSPAPSRISRLSRPCSASSAPWPRRINLPELQASVQLGGLAG